LKHPLKFIYIYIYKVKVKGKGHPRTGHEGPEVELYEGGWSTPHPGRFTLWKDPATIA